MTDEKSRLHNWERLGVFADADRELSTYRMQVPGGWVVCVADSFYYRGIPHVSAASLVFVSDPAHEWSRV